MHSNLEVVLHALLLIITPHEKVFIHNFFMNVIICCVYEKEARFVVHDTTSMLNLCKFEEV